MGKETDDGTIRHSRSHTTLLGMLNRHTLGVVTQARTERGYFGEYYQIHNIQEPVTCPCDADLQTREHLVFECIRETPEHNSQLTREPQITS